MSGTAVIEAPTAPIEEVQEPARPQGTAIEPPSEAVASGKSAVERVCAMSREQVIAAIEKGRLSRRELMVWASRFPEEVPQVNGEFPWIAYNLADLD